MITFEMKKNDKKPLEFAYDMRALSQSFFPEHPCEIKEREDWKEQEGYPLSCYFGDELFFHLDLPIGYDKNSVKAAVYRQFSEKANKTLPWGILTGIRPAKIPLEFRSALPSVSTVPFLLMITRVMPRRWMPI